MDKKDQEILDNCEKLHQALIVTQSNLSKRFTNPKGSKSMNNMFSKLGSIKPVEKSETVSDSSIQQETSVEVDNSSLNAKSASEEVAEQEQVQNDFSVTNEKVVDVTESSLDVAIDNSVDETEKKSDIKGSLDEGQPMADDSLIARRFDMFFQDRGVKSSSLFKAVPIWVGHLIKLICYYEKTRTPVFTINIILDWFVYNQEWFGREGHFDEFKVPESFLAINKPLKKSSFDVNDIQKFVIKERFNLSLNSDVLDLLNLFTLYYNVPCSFLFVNILLDWFKRYEPVLSKKPYWKNLQGLLPK